MILEDQVAATVEAFGKIAGALCESGHCSGSGVALRVMIKLSGRPEESLVLAVIDFRNPEGTAEAAVFRAIGLVGFLNAGPIVGEGVGLLIPVAEPAAHAAMVCVRAGFHQHVKRTACGPADLVIIGIR